MMKGKFVVVGFKARQFLTDLDSYMEKEGKRTGGIAVEVSVIGSTELSENEKTLLQAADYVVALIPVKLFPALRFNVDEYWDGVETWYSASQYREKILNMVNTSAKVSWVLTGIEGITVTNSFLDRETNRIIKNPPSDFDIGTSYEDVQDIVKQFLQEIDDADFWQDNSKWLYYLCFDKMGARKYQIGEKAVELWIRAPYNGMEILK